MIFKRIYSICIIIIFCKISDGISQRFQFAALGGINAAQIDGDSLYGYKKLGLHIGGRISYVNKNSFDIALEMLYSQRGAAKTLSENRPKDVIQADFIEIPIVFNIRDWYNKKDNYHKVRAEFGVSVAQMVLIESAKFDVQNFSKRDISWFLGGGLRFSRNLGIAGRYASSFINMYPDSSGNLPKFKSYFLTFRLEYYF